MPAIAREPRVDRVLRLNFQGDWGQANFHRICSWLTQEVIDRSGKGTKIAIWNGCGGADAALAVGRREVDLAISTPARFASMAIAGVGPFAQRAVPELRAIATLPQRDRLVMAVDERFGVESFEQLRVRKPALRIAASVDDGVNNIGFATQRMMEASGVSREEVLSWGGSYWEAERPEVCLGEATAGRVDAVIQEAIMTPWWQELMRTRKMRLLPFEPDAFAQVKKAYGWEPAAIPAGYFPGLTQSVAALDFSDFIILVHASMPEEVAHLLTWCLCETRHVLEAQYRHIPAERSPITFPLEPSSMAKTSVPLHPGARRYYKDAGIQV